MSELTDLLERVQEQNTKKSSRRNLFLHDFLRRLWHGKFVCLLIIALFLFLAWLAHFPLKNINRYSTKLEVMFMKERDANKQGNVAYEIAGQITGWTTTTNKYDEMMVMRSKSVLVKMLSDTHLLDTIIKKHIDEEGEFKSVEDSLHFIDTQVNRYAAAIDVSYDKIDKLHRTSIVTISMSGKDESVSTALTGLVNSYNKFTREYNEECYRKTLAFLENCIDSIRNELWKLDTADEEFSESNNIFNMDQQTNTYLDVDRNDEDAIKDMELQSRLLSIIRKYMTDMGSNYIVVPANIGIEDEQINRILLQFNDLVLRRSNFLTSMGEDAMRVQTITNQIEDQRKAIIISIDKLTEAFNIRMEKYKENETASKKRLLTMPHKRIVKDRLARERAIVLPLYSLMQQKHTETLIARSAEQDQARIISTPIVIEDNLLKYVKYLYLLGLLFGVIFSLVYLYRLKLPLEKVTISDVLNCAAIPCWAILPDLAKPVVYKPALQALLVRIRKINAYTIVVTSGFQGEGKTELSRQLTSLLSEMGEPNSLVEWNENDHVLLSKKIADSKKNGHYLVVDAGCYHENPEVPLITELADVTLYCLRYNYSGIQSIDFANYIKDERLIENGALVLVKAVTDERLRINFATFNYDNDEEFKTLVNQIKI